MRIIDILTIVLLVGCGGYSIRKVFVTNKREKNNQCYRCGKSLDGIETGCIRDGQTIYTFKDHKSCLDCVEKTKHRTFKLILYALAISVVAIVAAVLLGVD
ncbi:MAG: hypothetical protein GQ532_13780 [Methylomarinum sp.]|nr:hypothetical protein [Methylomarinum sp.]